MSTMQEDTPCVWYAEADEIEFSEEDFDTAYCAELPDELEHFANEAALDDTFDAKYEEWMSFLFECESVVLLGLEQSAHDGALLPWDMRAVRLADIPDEALSKLHFYWDHCPKHVAAHLTLLAYWVVRFERLRRKSHATWTCREPAPPAKEESAFFRPPRLVFRRQV
jgi:hypothetical protein